MEVPDRDQRDDDAAALLLLLLLRHRRELIELLGDPPDEQNIPAEFWTRIERETGDALGSILLLVFLASARVHGANTAERYQQAVDEALRWAAREAVRLAGLIIETSREMLAGYLDDWQARIEAGEQISDEEIDEKLSRIFGTARAARIAVDAVTTGQTRGGEWAVGEFAELSDDDEWQTIGDERVCPVCEPLNGTTRDVWGESFPLGPPIHPACRCAILYAALTPEPREPAEVPVSAD